MEKEYNENFIENVYKKNLEIYHIIKLTKSGDYIRKFGLFGEHNIRELNNKTNEYISMFRHINEEEKIDYVKTMTSQINDSIDKEPEKAGCYIQLFKEMVLQNFNGEDKDSTLEKQ